MCPKSRTIISMGLKFGEIVAVSALPHYHGQLQSCDCHFQYSLTASHKSMGKAAGSLNTVMISKLPACFSLANSLEKPAGNCKSKASREGKLLLLDGEGARGCARGGARVMESVRSVQAMWWSRRRCTRVFHEKRVCVDVWMAGISAEVLRESEWLGETYPSNMQSSLLASPLTFSLQAYHKQIQWGSQQKVRNHSRSH